MRMGVARTSALLGGMLAMACGGPTQPEVTLEGPVLQVFSSAPVWKGLTWAVTPGTASAGVNGSDHLELMRAATGQAAVTVPQVPGVNAQGTPWILFSYLDDAVSMQGFDLFINYNSSGPRISVGSLFSFAEGFGYERFGVPAQELPLYCVGSALPGCTPGSGRVAGVHTVYIGQRADGTIDANFDGTWFVGTYLRDNGQAPFPFNEVMLRWRSASAPGIATFVDFRAGNNHPGGGNKDACKDGGWQAAGLWKNQGDCVKYAQTGK